MNLGNHRITNLENPTNAKDAVNLRSLTFGNFQDTIVTAPVAANLLTFTGISNNAINAAVTGDITLSLSGTPNTINAQINAGVIVNADINNSAAIAQSKLAMNTASTRANATDIAQADRGLASFDSAQFDSTNGWISVKNNGLTLSKLSQIEAKSVIGNPENASGNAATIGFDTVVSDGGAIKKLQFSAIGFLKRIGTSGTADSDYSVVNDSSLTENNTLVRRNATGDFKSRIIDVEQLTVTDRVVINKSTTGTGGYTQIYGFLDQTGILIGDGTQVGDRKTLYYNDSHQFKNRTGASEGTVTMGSLTTTTLTSGAAGTNGTMTGNWTMSSTSNITFGTGVLDVTTGTLRSRSLTTGLSTTTGVITGQWSLTSGSRLVATYADLAEYYQSDKEYEVGTVLSFGGEFEVTMSKAANDHRVAGVVSDSAAYAMNSECPGIKVLIALQGRVPCRVVGKVSKGDLIVTSGIAGVAVSAKGDAKAGTIIGKALQAYDSDHIGTIEVAVGRT